jgi:hypothetical protein
MIKKFKQFESIETESEDKLIPLKFIIGEMVGESSLEDKDFHPQSKSAARSFCQNGRPSEYYLNNIVNKLKESGMDVSVLNN